MEDTFEVVCWPESQMLMEKPMFNENSSLINKEYNHYYNSDIWGIVAEEHGYKIPKGESKSFTINLQKERYKYSRGQYKIVKPFSFSTNEMKDSMMYYFSIK